MKEYFSCYILLTDQISLSGCLYFERYWTMCVLQSQFESPFFKGGGAGGGEIDLNKNPKKGGMEKLLSGGWRSKEAGRILEERGDAVSLGIFSSQSVANVTTVTIIYMLVIVFLFPLNVGVSPCFNCTGLRFSVYSVYASCFHNTAVSSCYRLHTSCLHHAGVTCFILSMQF